ncbi:MAG: response regulator transcription factor, partial [Cytophagales bacterium]|nr:response regulator transcription factor [Armatimonadota bacterium]
MPRTKKAAAPKPLTAAHRTLLATCLHLGTDDSRALATHLHLSVETVSTYFQRIHKRLGTVTRTEAILRYARETGL